MCSLVFLCSLHNDLASSEHRENPYRKVTIGRSQFSDGRKTSGFPLETSRVDGNSVKMKFGELWKFFGRLFGWFHIVRARPRSAGIASPSNLFLSIQIDFFQLPQMSEELLKRWQNVRSHVGVEPETPRTMRELVTYLTTESWRDIFSTEASLSRLVQ